MRERDSILDNETPHKTPQLHFSQQQNPNHETPTTQAARQVRGAREVLDPRLQDERAHPAV